MRLFGWAIDLALRIWLAQSFLAAAMGRMMARPEAAPWMPGGTLGNLAAGVEAFAPILIAVGLLTRPAALALFAVVCGPYLVGAPAAEHIRASVLLWYVLAGPGPLSVDALLRRGVGRAALPFSGQAARLSRALRAAAETAFLLALRVWVAWLLLAFFGFGFADPLHVLLSVLLIALGLGLAARPVALALGLLPLALPGMVDATAGYPTFPLALLVMTGPGLWSLDRAALRRLRARRERRLAGPLPHVVILGAGFAGVAAALKLRNAPARVTLVDRRNHHLFQPLLYQVATGALSPADIAVPIREIFREQKNAQVILDEVTGIDAEARRVRLAGGSLPYDQLVIATGSRTSYFGHDEWAPHALGLKDVDDATRIRRRILSAFEWAEAAETPERRERFLTFVVVGGGPTGVELAGSIAELARHGLVGGFRRIDPSSARIVLVQSADRLLPPFAPDLSEKAARDLRRLGVEIRLGSRFGGFDGQAVVLGEERLPTASVFWAAGVAASPAAEWLGVEPADRGGRIAVEPDLSLPDHPEVFVAGDVAASDAWGGKSVPGLAASAKVMGEHVGRVLLARVEGRREPGPFRYHHLGSLATIGRDAAVADFDRARISGSVAWWLWGAVHIMLLTGVRNRLSVAVDWLWAYLTYRQGTLLITGREPVRAPEDAAEGPPLFRHSPRRAEVA